MSFSPKVAIFVIGNRGTGKTSIIRTLTGFSARGRRIWHVRGVSGKLLRAFVVLSALQEDRSVNHIPPVEFPHALEEAYGVSADDYDLLICALELSVGTLYPFSDYADAFHTAGFDVRLSVIETDWQGNPNTTVVTSYACSVALSRPLITLNLSNGGEHAESNNIRNNLFP